MSLRVSTVVYARFQNIVHPIPNEYHNLRMDTKHSEAEAAKRVFGRATALPEDWRLHWRGLDHELCRTSTNQEMEGGKLSQHVPEQFAPLYIPPQQSQRS